MTKKLTNHLIAFFVVMTLAGGPADAGEADGFQALLYAGRLAEAAALSERQIQGEGDQFQAHFNLGVTRFLQSVERLSQSLYRHGLRSSLDVFFLPFFRLPVPDNPNPEPLNYEAARKIVDDFITDLADVEKTLAEVGSDHVRLPLDFGRIRLDIDGDDTATEEESLWRVFQRVAGPAPNTNPETIVDFDGSDAVWLRGYSHLLMAIGEFLVVSLDVV